MNWGGFIYSANMSACDLLMREGARVHMWYINEGETAM